MHSTISARLKTVRAFSARAAGVAVASGLAVAGLGGPALAAPVPVGSAPCASPWDLCLYGSTNFGGSNYKYNDAVEPRSCHGISGSVAGNVHSIVNKSTYAWKVYNNDSCSGTPIATIYARTANDNVGRVAMTGFKAA